MGTKRLAFVVVCALSAATAVADVCPSESVSLRWDCYVSSISEDFGEKVLDQWGEAGLSDEQAESVKLKVVEALLQDFLEAEATGQLSQEELTSFYKRAYACEKAQFVAWGFLWTSCAKQMLGERKVCPAVPVPEPGTIAPPCASSFELRFSGVEWTPEKLFEVLKSDTVCLSGLNRDWRTNWEECISETP